MTLSNVVLPSPRSDFVELARSPQGKLFRKQILHMGDFAHPKSPGQKVTVDEAFAQSLVKNFHDGQSIVQVPIVDKDNKHVEDPLRNLGEVIDVDYDDKGVWATIDARKKEYADELGKTLIGASAFLSQDYTDTKTGKKVGPTLLHVAVTNRPYITNLDGFDEIIAASADDSDDPPVFLAATDTTENNMTKDEILALLKAEHDIDVSDLQAKVAAIPEVTVPTGPNTKELVSALSAVLAEAGVISLSNSGKEATDDELGIEDVAAAVIELSQEKMDLAATVATLKEESDTLKLSAATSEVAQMVRAGRILPAQKDAMLELKLTNPTMFDKIVPDAPLIEMSARGLDVHDEPDSKKFDEEVERLSKLANESRTSGRKK